MANGVDGVEKAKRIASRQIRISVCVLELINFWPMSRIIFHFRLMIMKLLFPTRNQGYSPILPRKRLTTLVRTKLTVGQKRDLYKNTKIPNCFANVLAPWTPPLPLSSLSPLSLLYREAGWGPPRTPAGKSSFATTCELWHQMADHGDGEGGMSKHKVWNMIRVVWGMKSVCEIRGFISRLEKKLLAEHKRSG